MLRGQINSERPEGLSNFKTEIKIARELLWAFRIHTAEADRWRFNSIRLRPTLQILLYEYSRIIDISTILSKNDAHGGIVLSIV